MQERMHATHAFVMHRKRTLRQLSGRRCGRRVHDAALHHDARRDASVRHEHRPWALAAYLALLAERHAF